MKARFNDGQVIVDVDDNPLGRYVLLTVSKERFDEDAVQFKLSRPVAKAIGAMLQGDKA